MLLIAVNFSMKHAGKRSIIQYWPSELKECGGIFFSLILLLPHFAHFRERITHSFIQFMVLFIPAIDDAKT